MIAMRLPGPVWSIKAFTIAKTRATDEDAPEVDFNLSFRIFCSVKTHGPLARYDRAQPSLEVSWATAQLIELK